MPLVNFKAIEGVITPEQKRELITKLTDAVASVYGEGIRQVTWVVIEDVPSGEWGIAGKPGDHQRHHGPAGDRQEGARRLLRLEGRLSNG
jgi:4-oxalocrotonate tautomerase